MHLGLEMEVRSSVNSNRIAITWLLLSVATCSAAETNPPTNPPTNPKPRIAFAGLHGGVFEHLKSYAVPVGVDVVFLDDEKFGNESVDLSQFDLLLLQHTRSEYRSNYKALIEAGRAGNPKLRVFSISGLAEKDLPELTKSGVIETDPTIASYYGNTPENLRRLLIYLGVTYLGQPGSVVAPEPMVASGLYHPDHAGMFDQVADWKAWCQESRRETKNRPIVCITVHSTHLMFQQPRVVDSLIREFENQDALAVAIIDYGDDYEDQMLELHPDVVVHTCHSRDSVAFRNQLGVPHTHSIFFRQQSIDDWQISIEGLASSEMAFQIVGQELVGAIEPQIGAGTIHGGGSGEAFVPVPDRIEHLVARSLA